MSAQWIYGKADIGIATVESVGSKAYRLMQLHHKGFQVPDFYVISTDAIRQVLAGQRSESLSNASETDRAVFHDVLQSAEFGQSLLAAISSAHEKLFAVGAPVAVRSSAVCEDGQQRSYAGLYTSLIGVIEFSELTNAIRQVWKSASSPSIAAYRRRHGLNECDYRMAVVVQQMIDAKCSGVCFTRDPIDIESSDQMVISALFGLGEGLVSRSYPADTYRVDRTTEAIDSELAEKDIQIQWTGHSHRVQEIVVEGNERLTSSLTPEQIRQVARVCREIESSFAEPQDVEFCFDQQDRLSILQTRPITGPSNPRDEQSYAGETDNLIIWDNSNIIESYSGVTTPMTFSFIRRAYSIVYHCFAQVMGISPTVVSGNRETFENMLGFFHGRVYYNVMNWYRLIGMFPGYHYNRQFLESMMGVSQSVMADQDSRPIGFWRRWLIEFPSLLKLIVRSGWNFLRIRHTVDQFQRHFYRYHDEWVKIDFDSIPATEMARLYDSMEQKMLWNWKAPIINDFFVMIFYGVLRKLCVHWCGDENASLQNGLVCGEGGLQSDEPAKQLIHMAQIAGADPVLREMIVNESLLELPDRVAADARFSEFNALMSDYLDQYGLRCANELRLESFSYLDQPHRLYGLLRSYLTTQSSSIRDPDAILKREHSIRQRAELQADQALADRRGWFPRRLVFRWVLKNARLGVRNRENMRFARTRIYGILRRMLRSIGRRFAEQGILQDREDIFFLTLDEVWSYVRGTAVTTDLKSLAELRKRDYQRCVDGVTAVPADRFETTGMPYHRNVITKPIPTTPDDTSVQLKGIGCCPGVVSGIAQVISDPTRDTYFEGDLLVAERTDPGWVPFFPAFSGILVERGSVLSHSAIVAREMGIPTIVSIAGLTRQVRSGQRIEMDGQSGIVKIGPSVD